MSENSTNEMMEKLNQSIQDSQRMMQEQNAKLLQEFFGDSVKGLKEQVSENQSTLESLTDKIPGGQEGPFRHIIKELVDAYSIIEESLDDAMETVSGIDVKGRIDEALGEAEGAEKEETEEGVKATEAAREKAEELGLDLPKLEVKGSGSGGLITIKDVMEAGRDAQYGVEAAGNQLEATEAARRKARELGLDLSTVQGTGSNGRIIFSDVVEAAGVTEPPISEGQG